MPHPGFFLAAVASGIAILVAIIVNYLKKDTSQKVTLSTAMVIVAFALVSSPLWSAITVKGGEVEINLVRENSQKLAEDLVELVGALEKTLSPEQRKEVDPILKETKKSLKEIRLVGESREEMLTSIGKALEAILKSTRELTNTMVSLAP